MAYVVEAGPWGGEGGSPWKFTINGGRINSVTLSTCGGGDNTCVSSLQFTYTDKHNKQYRSGQFGKLFDNVETYTFADDEHLTEVSGTFGVWSSMTVVTSLTFKTNKTVYGPYGTQNGTRFSLPVTSGKFDGFFGSSGDVIDSLGGVLLP